MSSVLTRGSADAIFGVRKAKPAAAAVVAARKERREVVGGGALQRGVRRAVAERMAEGRAVIKAILGKSARDKCSGEHGSLAGKWRNDKV